MAVVTRKITYPDGRVVEEIIDVISSTPVKKREKKVDVPKSKPEETGKSVRKTYTTDSKS